MAGAFIHPRQAGSPLRERSQTEFDRSRSNSARFACILLVQSAKILLLIACLPLFVIALAAGQACKNSSRLHVHIASALTALTLINALAIEIAASFYLLSI